MAYIRVLFLLLLAFVTCNLSTCHAKEVDVASQTKSIQQEVKTIETDYKNFYIKNADDNIEASTAIASTGQEEFDSDPCYRLAKQELLDEIAKVNAYMTQVAEELENDKIMMRMSVREHSSADGDTVCIVGKFDKPYMQDEKEASGLPSIVENKRKSSIDAKGRVGRCTDNESLQEILTSTCTKQDAKKKRNNQKKSPKSTLLTY